MNNGSRIKEQRIKAGLTQEELANKLGLQKSAIAKYENGRVTNIKRSTIDAMASIFNCRPSYLMGWDDKIESDTADFFSKFPNLMPISKHKIPMLGEIACGRPIYADEDRECYVEVGTNVQADFCLRAKGDSMIGARIMDGDIIFVRRQDMVDNGEIAVVIIGDNATLKRVYYYPEQGKLVLNAENPAYEPFVYVGEELNEIHILGKAVAFQSDVR